MFGLHKGYMVNTDYNMKQCRKCTSGAGHSAGPVTDIYVSAYLKSGGHFMSMPGCQEVL